MYAGGARGTRALPVIGLRRSRAPPPTWSRWRARASVARNRLFVMRSRAGNDLSPGTEGSRPNGNRRLLQTCWGDPVHCSFSAREHRDRGGRTGAILLTLRGSLRALARRLRCPLRPGAHRGLTGRAPIVVCREAARTGHAPRTTFSRARPDRRAAPRTQGTDRSSSRNPWAPRSPHRLRWHGTPRRARERSG